LYDSVNPDDLMRGYLRNGGGQTGQGTSNGWLDCSSDLGAAGVTLNSANLTSDSYYLQISPMIDTAIGDAWFDDFKLYDKTTGQEVVIYNGNLDENRADQDSAVAVLALGAQIGLGSARLPKKPVMDSNACMIGNQTNLPFTLPDWYIDYEEPWLYKDEAGVWYRKFLWSQLSAYGVISLYYIPNNIAYYGLWKYAKALQMFMAAIPLSNGTFVDAEAVSSDDSVRVVGQKGYPLDGDTWGTDQLPMALLWIDPKDSNWWNVVHNGPPTNLWSAAITLYMPAGPYNINWYSTSTGEIVKQGFAFPFVTHTGLPPITLYANNLPSDIAVQIVAHQLTVSKRLAYPEIDTSFDGSALYAEYGDIPGDSTSAAIAKTRILYHPVGSNGADITNGSPKISIANIDNQPWFWSANDTWVGQPQLLSMAKAGHGDYIFEIASSNLVAASRYQVTCTATGAVPLNLVCTGAELIAVFTESAPIITPAPVTNDFDTERFRAQIHAMGESIGWLRGMKCPCGDPVTGTRDRNCPLCGGVGTAYEAQDIAAYKAMVQNVTQQMAMANYGTMQVGDIVITTMPDEIPLREMDMIIIPSRSMTQEETFRHGASDRLRWVPVQSVAEMRTLTTVFVETRDFSVDLVTGAITWVHPPDVGTVVSVRYESTPTYIALASSLLIRRSVGGVKMSQRITVRLKPLEYHE